MVETKGTLIDRDGLANVPWHPARFQDPTACFELDGELMYLVLNWSGEIVRAFAQPLDGSGDPADWPWWIAEA